MRIKLNIFNLEVSNEPKPKEQQMFLLQQGGMQLVDLKDPNKGIVMSEVDYDEYNKKLKAYLIKELPSEDPKKIEYILSLIENFDMEE